MAYPRISNANIWDAIRAKYPNFENHTAKATKELFTAEGFEQMRANDPDLLNDFYLLSMRVYLQEVNISRAKDTLAANGFGEYFDQPLGGITQRMAINSVKPVSPAYRNLVNGPGPDPFVVRKPTVSERFFKQNYDYQSFITVQDEFQLKTIFISEYGMSEFMGGIMTGLENGYIIQTFVNKLEALNAAINSTATPLQNTQQAVVKYTTGTKEEQGQLWLTIKNIVDAMALGPQTKAYNAMGFASIQDKSRLKVLIRPGYKNVMNLELFATIFNPDRLGMDVDPFIEVPHFGGLIPQDDEGTTLEPKYDAYGTEIGFVDPGQSSVVINEDDITWVDPNADVIAVIADQGVIFHAQQNPYVVEPIRNPRGLYTNYWASSPGNSIHYDALYNMVVIRKVAQLP